MEGENSHINNEEDKEVIRESHVSDQKQLNKKNLHCIFDGLSNEWLETREKLGNFMHTKRPPSYLEWRDINIDPENGKYLGQWNPKTNLMEGIGILVKSDGSIIEAYRKNGSIVGIGRGIYSDGDYYEGYSKNRKFQGKGIYFINWFKINIMNSYYQ